jgi:hypothetical protein
MSGAPSPEAAGHLYRDRIVRPVLVVSTPRSGSTLLFETLVKAPGLFSAGGESHVRIEQIADFFPARRGWTSNRLDATDAKPESIEELARSFYSVLKDRDGHSPSGEVRMLEKTPKNSLRVPFFDAAWPDSVFVYLYRDVRQTLASMMEAWASGRFVTYPVLPGWRGPPWSLLLVPGWRELVGRPLPEIVAAQWAATTDILVSDLEALPAERLVTLNYDDFIAEPQSAMERLTRSLGMDWDQQLGATLPPSKYTTSRPAKDKWKRLAPVIEAMLPAVAAADERARAFLARYA